MSRTVNSNSGAGRRLADGGRVPGSSSLRDLLVSAAEAAAELVDDRSAAAGGRVPGALVGGIDYAEAVPDPGWAALEPTGTPAGVRVGLIDTGIVELGDSIHPWLRERVRRGPYGEGDPLDTDLDGALDTADAHGTFVAGLILSRAPSAQVTAMRVLDDGLGDDPSIAAAIRLLAKDHQLINLSFGGTVEETAPPRVLELVLSEVPADVLVVCSAGNFGDERPHWPGAFNVPNLVCVGALDEPAWDRKGSAPPIASFSTRGPWVDAYANGVQLTSTHCWFSESRAGAARHRRPAQDYRGWARWSGTSFATAAVTGAIARRFVARTPDDPPADRWTVPAAWEALRAESPIIDDGPGSGKPWVTALDPRAVPAVPPLVLHEGSDDPELAWPPS